MVLHVVVLAWPEPNRLACNWQRYTHLQQLLNYCKLLGKLQDLDDVTNEADMNPCIHVANVLAAQQPLPRWVLTHVAVQVDQQLQSTAAADRNI
jgi:hypothetical protein